MMTLITLSTQESATLGKLIAHTKDATQLRRAQALLWLDAGEGVPGVAERLRVSRRTIYHWVTRFQERRALDLPARLLDGTRPGRPRTVQGIIDPLIDAVIDRDPRDYGYRFTVWTASLLQHYLQEVHHRAVSRKSVSLAMARLGLRWKRPRHDLVRRAAHWRQATGGSNVGWPHGSGLSS
jgi:transposase